MTVYDGFFFWNWKLEIYKRRKLVKSIDSLFISLFDVCKSIQHFRLNQHFSSQSTILISINILITIKIFISFNIFHLSQSFILISINNSHLNQQFSSQSTILISINNFHLNQQFSSQSTLWWSHTLYSRIALKSLYFRLCLFPCPLDGVKESSLT
jgi:uncharacterized protein (DUF486 family)